MSKLKFKAEDYKKKAMANLTEITVEDAVKISQKVYDEHVSKLPKVYGTWDDDRSTDIY